MCICGVLEEEFFNYSGLSKAKPFQYLGSLLNKYKEEINLCAILPSFHTPSLPCFQ